MAFAPSIFVFSILRFIIGITEGILFGVLPMYIGEISDPQIRGFLASLTVVAYIVGTLFINIIGDPIFTSSLICALIPLIHFFTFVWMPESPYYYIKKKKFEEASRSLKILTEKEDVGEEMEELCKVVERQEANSGRIIELFTVYGNRKVFFICLILSLVYAFCGKIPTQVYTNMIFKEAGTNFSASVSTIIYCSVELIAALATTFVIDRSGRRPLCILSTLGCSICLFALGTYFYLKNLGISGLVESWGWASLTSLVAFNILFSVGLGFAPFVLSGELFPTNVKTAAVTLVDSLCVVMAAVASKFFQISKDEFGMFVPFWAYAICCVVGLVLIVSFVPETKKKSLEEIQFHLNEKKYEKRNKRNNIN